MNHIQLAILFLLSAFALTAQPQEKPALAEHYPALLKEYNSAALAFRNATSDEERKAAVERLDEFALRFLELAEKNPNDPLVLDVLTQVIRAVNAVDSLTQTAWELNKTAFPRGSKNNAAGRAIALLRRHVQSEKVGQVCERMRYGIRPEFETFLRAVLEKNPHREVQAITCIALAQYLNGRLQKLNLANGRPELAKRFEGLFGKEQFAELQRPGRDSLAQEVEALFEQAAGKYADVAMPFGGAIGEKAKSELFEIRQLAIGKEAPDIEGLDQHGKSFKLSDYRGKVVLLDFWSEY